MIPLLNDLVMLPGTYGAQPRRRNVSLAPERPGVAFRPQRFEEEREAGRPADRENPEFLVRGRL